MDLLPKCDQACWRGLAFVLCTYIMLHNQKGTQCFCCALQFYGACLNGSRAWLVMEYLEVSSCT